MSNELEVREFQIRAETEDVADKREVSGIAVPWDTDTDIGGYYTERVERGAVQESDGALLFWRHDEPIGKVVSHRDTDEGWEITAVISETPRGNEAYTLIRDGVITKLSIGFQPVEHREEEDGTIVRTKIRVCEVSLVPLPAYEGASISEVRENQNISKEKNMADNAVDLSDFQEVRETVETLERRMSTFQSAPEAPVVDQRSAGAVLKAIVEGDSATIDMYNRHQEHMHDELQQRATSGSTTADVPVRAQYVTSLVRLFDNSSGVQSRIFDRGTLPATGMNVEYVRLASNTLRVEQQVNEGYTLAFGKLTFSNDSTPVKTYGGWTELSRQAIERSSIPVLNTTLEALTIEAGRRKKIELRAAVASVITAREAIASNGGVVVLGATLAASAADNWEDALIDAAIRYDLEGATPEALVVSASVFKKLRSLTVAGERVFRVAQENASGTLNLPGLTGDLAGIPVYLDAGQTGDKAYFVNGRAIKQYDSALYALSDENITNLTKQFSVYFYGAIAAEVPQLIVPVKLAAS